MLAVTKYDRARLPRDGDPNLRLPAITQLTNAVMDTLLDERGTVHAPTAIGVAPQPLVLSYSVRSSMRTCSALYRPTRGL